MCVIKTLWSLMKDSQGVGHVSNTLVFFLCSSADDNFYDYQSDHIYWFLCVSYFINIVIDDVFYTALFRQN